jgi:hypothetical protein
MRIPEQTPADATAGLTKTSAKVQLRSFTPKELDFFQFQGEPYVIAYMPRRQPSPRPAELGHRRGDESAHLIATT